MSFDPTGYTLAHEHLHIDLSGFKNNVDCRLDQYAFICQEMNDLMTRGVRNVIEMTNRYMGRNAQFMLDVMRETGINVVACTGYRYGKPGTPTQARILGRSCNRRRDNRRLRYFCICG